MIQINLLPVKEAKRRRQLFLAFYAGVSGLLLLAVLGWFWWTQYQKVDDLKSQIKKVEDESKGYEDKIKEVKDLQAKQASLEIYRAAITAIYNDQKMMLSALDEIGVDLPSDILLDSIEEGRDKSDNVLTLKGFAMTQASIQTFIGLLKRPNGPFSSPSLEDVVIKPDKSGTYGTYSFTLKVQMEGPK